MQMQSMHLVKLHIVNEMLALARKYTRRISERTCTELVK